MASNDGVDRERALLAQRLGSIIEVAALEIDRSAVLENESYLPHKRNMVAVLARLAQLVSLAEDLRRNGSQDWWRLAGSDGHTPLERMLSGRITEVCSELEERKAGPYDLEWDPSWPPDVAAQQFNSRVSVGVKPGDVLTAAVGAGRVKLRVLELSDGTITAELVTNTWVGPPYEDVAEDTYRQLASKYPSDVPAPG
jgi:hypothetical protein